ncbi:hypothetical protein [Anaerobaca lacustris]|uniref:Uncharacterized protein n=1 Tax=Anaerobaca lacustris TaxID=3044600 RepID=A0AAW6TYZ1_9BACT|nr:hypothetical protein [Sedimentisphaerales bacterium M17dextr]
MGQARPCDGCRQAHNCAAVYERLGRAGGPSVALKAMVAFALPIAAFAIVLATFEHLLANAVAERSRTFVAFVVALALTVGLMRVVSLLVGRRREPH